MNNTQNPHRSTAILKSRTTGAKTTRGHAIAQIWGGVACAFASLLAFSAAASGSILGFLLGCIFFVCVVPLFATGAGNLLRINRHQADLDLADAQQWEAEKALMQQTAHGSARMDSGTVLAASGSENGGFTIDIPAQKEGAP